MPKSGNKRNSSAKDKLRMARAATNKNNLNRLAKKYVTTNTGRLRTKLAVKRKLNTAGIKVKSKAIGLAGRAFNAKTRLSGGSTKGAAEGGVYKFTAARRAALKKAQAASAAARRGGRAVVNAANRVSDKITGNKRYSGRGGDPRSVRSDPRKNRYDSGARGRARPKRYGGRGGDPRSMRRRGPR